MRVQTGSMTFQATTALAPYLRVKLTASKLVVAEAADRDLGTLESRVLAADDYAAVVPPNMTGTVKMVVSAAVTKFAKVYGSAGGKVSSAINGNFIGVALDSASADGSYIEVLRLDQELNKDVEAHTADDTLTVDESGSVHTTVGAAGAVTFTLPAAVTGIEYLFRVGAAQELRIDPAGTETVALPSTGVQGAAGKYLTANADGESVHIVCDKAGEWTVYGFTGTWTAEA